MSCARPSAARGPEMATICKLCDGTEVVRVFFQWSRAHHGYVVLAGGYELACVCVEGGR